MLAQVPIDESEWLFPAGIIIAKKGWCVNILMHIFLNEQDKSKTWTRSKFGWRKTVVMVEKAILDIGIEKMNSADHARAGCRVMGMQKRTLEMHLMRVRFDIST